MKISKDIFFITIYALWVVTGVFTFLVTVLVLLENPVLEPVKIARFLFSELIGFSVVAFGTLIWKQKKELINIKNSFINISVNLLFLICVFYIVEFLMIIVNEADVIDCVIILFALITVICVLIFIVSHNISVLVKNKLNNSQLKKQQSWFIFAVCGFVFLIIFTYIIEKRFFIYIKGENKDFTLTIWKQPFKSSNCCYIYNKKYQGILPRKKNCIVLPSNSLLDFYLLKDTVYIFSRPLYYSSTEHNNIRIESYKISDIFLYNYSSLAEFEEVIADPTELAYLKMEEELLEKNTWQFRFNITLNQPIPIE